MPTDPRLHTLLTALGDRIGIADLELNDDHVCRLVLGESIVLDIEHQAGTDNVQVFSVVGHHPRHNVALCHQLLAANLFGQGTGGAVLGLDEQRDEVLLTQGFVLGVTTAEQFVSTVEGFVGYVQHWAETIMHAEDAADEAEEDEGEAPDEPATDAMAFIRV